MLHNIIIFHFMRIINFKASIKISFCFICKDNSLRLESTFYLDIVSKAETFISRNFFEENFTQYSPIFTWRVDTHSKLFDFTYFFTYCPLSNTKIIKTPNSIKIIFELGQFWKWACLSFVLKQQLTSSVVEPEKKLNFISTE